MLSTTLVYESLRALVNQPEKIVESQTEKAIPQIQAPQSVENPSLKYEGSYFGCLDWQVQQMGQS